MADGAGTGNLLIQPQIGICDQSVFGHFHPAVHYFTGKGVKRLRSVGLLRVG